VKDLHVQRLFFFLPAGECPNDQQHRKQGRKQVTSSHFAPPLPKNEGRAERSIRLVGIVVQESGATRYIQLFTATTQYGNLVLILGDDVLHTPEALVHGHDP
jgi:hypothetical protein